MILKTALVRGCENIITVESKELELNLKAVFNGSDYKCKMVITCEEIEDEIEIREYKGE